MTFKELDAKMRVYEAGEYKSFLTNKSIDQNK